MILEASPESSALVRAATVAILYLHIGGGTTGILSGAVALATSKGARLHRVAGNIFFVSMLIMSAIGAMVSPFLPKPQWANVFIGALTFYLVATSWITIRRQEGNVGHFEIGAFIVALSISLGALATGTLAINAPKGMIDGLPYGAAFGFAAVWGMVATADLKVILRGGVFGRQRIVRHLWRMCVALLIAVVSLFLGQAQLFPTSVRGTGLLFVPGIAVLGSMLFWLARLRFAKRGDRLTVSAQRQSAPSPPTTAY
jgi:uncharacterized membrane protein